MKKVKAESRSAVYPLHLENRERGITLIALVITIIVLLILAGVSIAMLTGENGILTQAQKAKTTTDNKSAEEKVKLAVMAARTQSQTGSLELEKLKTEVTNNYGGQVKGGAFPATVTIDGKSFTVDSDGNVTSKDSETAGKVTIIEGDGKSVGNIIAVTSTKGTTERFYVLSYDENTKKAKALAEWNLMVGGIYNSSGTKTGDVNTSATNYGLQNSEMKGYVSGQERKGTVAFSSSKYWSNTTKYPNQTPEHSSVYPWVYNKSETSCTISQYVESYRTLLGNTDKVREVSLASYEDINALWSNKSSYPWLCNTSYWCGSTYGSSYISVWTALVDGIFGHDDCNNNNTRGVRPVITVDMSNS